jgi:hypothetical protein
MRWVLGLLMVLLCWVGPAAGAVGLGDLAVLSGLGERFWAELPLIGSGLTGELEISFGTENDYRSLGLERKEVVGDLVPLLSAEGAARIYLYSLHAIHEASFDVLVKVHTSEATVSRAYHIQLAEEEAVRPLPREEVPAPPPAPIEQAPATVPVARHPYVIHVASYRQSAPARGQVEELRARGADAFMVLTRIPQKGLFYRVLVGRYSTLREAAENASRLKETVRLTHSTPLKLPYSVGADIGNEAALVRRGYRLRLIPGCSFEEEGRPTVVLSAYATSEEAAALAAALTKNGIPARVVMP